MQLLCDARVYGDARVRAHRAHIQFTYFHTISFTRPEESECMKKSAPFNFTFMFIISTVYCVAFRVHGGVVNGKSWILVHYHSCPYE